MKRLALIFTVALLWSCSQAEDTQNATAPATPDYQAGEHYEVLNPAYDTGETDKVIVYEFFGYLCPHCNSFQPYMQQLESGLPDNAEIVRVPVIFAPQWKIYAQAFYTADSMGILEKSHQAMFQAIHRHNKRFRSIEEIADWYADSFGVDRDQFLSTANSFMIDGMLRKSDKMMRAMKISQTPTVVVNGKYKPNVKNLKTRQDLMAVLDQLLSMEGAPKAASAGE